MKKNKTKHRKITICGYLILLIALFTQSSAANCGTPGICVLGKSEHIDFVENKQIELSDLIYLLENIDNQTLVTRKITELGFTTRANGIYVTQALDRNRRPISIITILSIGSYKTVSLKISELSQFTHLVDHITANYKAEKANRSVFEELEMRFLGNKFICDVFVPLNGVNTSNNDYFEIIVSKR
jgi:hypothetical protein